MKVLFWLVKNKVNKRGECPIYCRITIDGKRAEIFSEIYAKEGEFDNNKKKLKGSSDLAEKKNQQLENLKFRIFNTYHNEVLNNNIPSAQEIKILIETRQRRTVFLADLLDEYANERFRIQGNLNRKETHERFITIVKRSLKSLNLPKVQISQCDSYFLDQLAHQIVNIEEYSPAYTKKLFGFVKSALLFAFNRRYTDRLLMNEYTFPYRLKSEIIYLNELEVDKIRQHHFGHPLQKYADLFIVQCYTGLAYADLKKLNATHLAKDESGQLWINLSRQKVDTAECVIPVINKVWSILKKYNFELPVFSNQKYNAALKLIAGEVGIRKKLTTHVGRKTYGTLLLNKDVPIETVSNLLGHSSIRTTQKHYAKVLHMKIARDVRLVL
jgi:integrase/recombinase XerD